MTKVDYNRQGGKTGNSRAIGMYHDEWKSMNIILLHCFNSFIYLNWINLSIQVHILRICSILLKKILTHFRLFPFDTPSKHQKTKRFSDVFRGYRDGKLTGNELIENFHLCGVSLSYHTQILQSNGS